MRRSKGEIIARVLEVCMTGASKTRVVYGSDLNFRTVRPYLDSLLANGHIVITDEKTRKIRLQIKARNF